MSDKNRVSIIIPIYNVEGYISECIDSVLAQVISPYEIILIDDGSTDHTYDICKLYEKKYDNINLIYQENQGVAAARNRGIEEANGDWILFIDSDDIINEKAILCTNTSGMSITKIASAAKHPERVVGTHFFMPVPAMRLVEIIPGLLTSDDVEKKAFEFGETIGKTTVKAPDTAGFLVNRIFEPMRNEAIYLVMEGNSPKDVDTAMKLGCNWPMGPLELADYTGLDTLLASMTKIYEEMGDPKYRPCPLLKKMVNAGMLGKKSGRGFYEYR